MVAGFQKQSETAETLIIVFLQILYEDVGGISGVRYRRLSSDRSTITVVGDTVKHGNTMNVRESSKDRRYPYRSIERCVVDTIRQLTKMAAPRSSEGRAGCSVSQAESEQTTDGAVLFVPSDRKRRYGRSLSKIRTHSTVPVGGSVTPRSLWSVDTA